MTRASYKKVCLVLIPMLVRGWRGHQINTSKACLKIIYSIERIIIYTFLINSENIVYDMIG